MTTKPMMSMAAAKAALDAALALIGATGKIKIYDGTPPVSLAAAITGTLLSTLTFAATAFAASADGGSNGLATALANTIASDPSAAASGTATHFRATQAAGTPVLQGNVGTSAADLIMTTTAIVATDVIAITAFVVTLADGSGVD